ncbi:MAG: cytochrome P450 [Myxococcota bacterium]|nr:cytochrome P450 [Myxococcota bacterium]
MTRAPLCSRNPEEVLDSRTIEDPHAFYARVREEHPLSRVAETGVHLVATWEGIIEVLNRTDDFSANLTGVLVRDEQNQPIAFDLPATDGTQVIATADEPHHAIHRKLIRPRLSDARIAKLEDTIRGWTRESLAGWLENGGGDFAPLAEIVPARAVGSLLGLPDGDVEQHRLWAMMGGEILAGDVNQDSMMGLAMETGKMAEYLRDHLERAMNDPDRPDPGEESLLHTLADGVQAGQITASEATGIAIVMFGAGGESTSSLIGSAVRLLAQDPDLAQQLREEPELIARFVEEALRMEPPFKFHYRAVRRECELAGFTLVPGDRLMLLWAAANRDPAIFPSPDSLQLDRKHPKHHMSFGRGTHFCIGATLARLETRVVIEEILKSTKRFQLDSEAPFEPARSIFVRRLHRLPLVCESSI